MDNENLRKWFLEKKRDLPWRDSPTPYAVWISEIMLQQTQVAVVVPYFLRWMEAYPTLSHLAKAEESSVMKLWEGLGYYSRARNLLKGARHVMEHFGGSLPDDPSLLAKIPGIGPYTVGAICAFAFKKKAAAVDGNVLRVLSRYYLVTEEIHKSRTTDEIREKALDFLPNHRPWEVAEALIELGATLCTRVPKCNSCPLKAGCKAHEEGLEMALPRRKKRPNVKLLYRAVPVIYSGQRLLLNRVEGKKVMSGLAEFPYLESPEKRMSPNHLNKLLLEKWQLSLCHVSSLSDISHGFTRYRAFLYPELFQCSNTIAVESYQWVPFHEVMNLAFSSGHKRILQYVRKVL